jgi:hypothetical protein
MERCWISRRSALRYEQTMFARSLGASLARCQNSSWKIDVCSNFQIRNLEQHYNWPPPFSIINLDIEYQQFLKTTEHWRSQDSFSCSQTLHLLLLNIPSLWESRTPTPLLAIPSFTRPSDVPEGNEFRDSATVFWQQHVDFRIDKLTFSSS